MAVKIVGASLMAVWLAASFAAAEGIALGGPANLPPPGFKGQQFVDNRGCVFLRAGIGGTVNWVPRVDRQHKPICNIAASGGAVPAAPEVKAAPVVVSTTPATAPAIAAVKAAPRRVAPVAVEAQAHPAVRAVPKPPKGWTLAWKDDRLNPMRAVGTAAGQAAQDRLWTRTVPMALVAEQPAKAVPKPRLKTTVSTMSAPQQTSTSPPQGKAGSGFVQVGAFANPANAVRVSAQLQVAGLPVSITEIHRKGKTIQLVVAGPFATAESAAAGLTTIRKAGFHDAFLR